LIDLLVHEFKGKTDMKPVIHTLVAVAALCAVPLSFASTDLAKKNACLACHAVDSKVVGPSFKEVAARYASDKDAVSKLSVSIKTGGKGKWGAITMPASEQLSDADARALAVWVAGLK
jgi:cytochrome c